MTTFKVMVYVLGFRKFFRRDVPSESLVSVMVELSRDFPTGTVTAELERK